jgi:hypothetical protein
MYGTDTELELPMVVDGLIVGYAETPCHVVLDEHADLIRLELGAWTGSLIKNKPSIRITKASTGDKSIIFQEAREAVKRCEEHLRELCGIPYLEPVEMPDYTDSRHWGRALRSAFSS